ncbi:MAG: hypothetical protein JW889_10070 [Verrucomicrobia bacterium]|nr:hypothetical protein [Verrucomicrobiota bacterium]
MAIQHAMMTAKTGTGHGVANATATTAKAIAIVATIHPTSRREIHMVGTR